MGSVIQHQLGVDFPFFCPFDNGVSTALFILIESICRMIWEWFTQNVGVVYTEFGSGLHRIGSGLHRVWEWFTQKPSLISSFEGTQKKIGYFYTRILGN